MLFVEAVHGKSFVCTLLLQYRRWYFHSHTFPETVHKHIIGHNDGTGWSNEDTLVRVNLNTEGERSSKQNYVLFPQFDSKLLLISGTFYSSEFEKMIFRIQACNTRVRCSSCRYFEETTALFEISSRRLFVCKRATSRRRLFSVDPLKRYRDTRFTT